jgi:lipoprotein-releasing system permease protein
LRRKGDGIDKLRLYLDDAFNANAVVNRLTVDFDNTNINSVNTQITPEFTTWNESQGA